MSDCSMKQDNAISRLVLGTAQLCMNYGIADQTGAPTKKEAFQILECAWEAGVRHFDTAPGYQSESIIGNFVKTHRLGKEIMMMTKIPSLAAKDDWKDFALKSVEKSFENLSTDRVKVLFLHSPEDSKLLIDDPDFFQSLTERFPIESLGISIYDPETVMETIPVCSGLAYQFPYNILDRRFEAVPIPKGKRYARSIFLQGLLASSQILTDAPEPVRRLHHAIWTDCAALGLSSKDAAWSFVNESDCLDYYLVGVETADQLRDLVKLNHVGLDSVDGLVKKWRKLISADWLDPRKWN